MHILKLSAAVLLVGAIAQPALVQPAFAQNAPAAKAAEKPAAPKLERAAIDAFLARPGSVTFLDVRRADEISTIGGLPVFLNIQLGDLENRLGWIPRDRPVVTISNHAARAGKAAAALKAKGFRVSGAIGIEDYVAQGGSVTRGAPPKAAPAAAQ
jgi:rhodanese-related sulfurtransferase